MEKSFAEIGVKPAGRQTILGREVLFGDGFVSADDCDKLTKFGVDREDYPQGCYTTVWLWAKDDSIAIGLPIFFDYDHDITQPLSTRKTMRLNSAKQSATMAITAMQKAMENAH